MSSLQTIPYTSTDTHMSEECLAYFKQKLINWRNELLADINNSLHLMQEEINQEADSIDFACNEITRSLELRTRDRERKLVTKINLALLRIEEGTYGYCEETGELIDFKRLDARPIATLSIEAQEKHERRERVYACF